MHKPVTSWRRDRESGRFDASPDCPQSTPGSRENALALSIEIDAEATVARTLTAMGQLKKNSRRAYVFRNAIDSCRKRAAQHLPRGIAFETGDNVADLAGFLRIDSSRRVEDAAVEARMEGLALFRGLRIRAPATPAGMILSRSWSSRCARSCAAGNMLRIWSCSRERRKHFFDNS